MRDYKKYSVWLKSHELTMKVYQEIAPCFPESEKFGLTRQITRAAYSIPFNISEGCSRSSEKEFAHFLEISLGSANELEYSFLLTKDLAFITEEQYAVLFEKINAIKAMIINLIKKVRSETT
jgi:four helix bundle protein